MSRLSASQHVLQQHLTVPSAKPIQPLLSNWVLSIPGVSRIVDRIGITEFRRRIFHMSPSLLPVALPFLPHKDVWGAPLLCIVMISSVTVLVLAKVLGPILVRSDEINWMGAVLGYMGPVVTALIIFPGRAEWGLMTLQILALGDGSATFGGLMLGGRRLPWNRKKTFSGLFCFAIVGSLAASYSFWGEARPGVPFAKAFTICSVAALCAALVESLPIRSNDNLRVGITALTVGIVMSSLVI
jgi:dolichol kinase